MTETLLRMLCGATLGLALVLLLRRPARRVFGAGPAFTLWLLPIMLVLAPLLPQELVPGAIVVLPGLMVTPHLAASTASPPVTIDWEQGLFAAWLGGAAIGMLRLAAHYARLLRGMHRPSAMLLRALHDVAPQLDRRRVRIHQAGPAVLWALPRSLTLLPTDFMERFGNDATRGLVLRHELTHLRRGDAWWSLAMEIASALLWFHPLAWMARPRFRLDQELACDAASLRALSTRTPGYARALIESVAVRPAPALIPWLAEPQLKERIAMIIRIPPGALRRRAGFIAVAALLAGSSYVAGAQAPVAAAVRADSKSAPPAVDIAYKNRNPPAYPGDAARAGKQGTVILDVTVSSAGKVTSLAVDPNGTTADPELQAAAISAAGRWKFKPGLKSGKRVGGTVKVPVRFALSMPGQPKPKLCPAGTQFVAQTKQCVKMIRPVHTSA